MRPGLVVLLLVALALVAVCVVGLASEGSFTPDIATWRERWFPGDSDGGRDDSASSGAGLGRVARSEARESPPDCLHSFVGSDCRLEVGESGRFLRRLQVSSSDQVSLTFVPKRTGDEVKAKLTGSFKDKSIDLLIDSAGATLGFTCVAPLPSKSPATCAVNVALGAGP